jgi:hypothetical protein
MTNVIKVKFLRNGKPSGRAYTYYTPEEVQVDDIVELESRNGIAQGVVVDIDVPEEEILIFGNAAKSILGKYAGKIEDTGRNVLSPDIQKVFDDINEALEEADANAS